MEQENFSPQQSLQLINSMINKAKRRFGENGFLYLLWGWVIFCCSVGHFILITTTGIKHPEIIWTLCWLAVIFQIIYLIKNKKKETVKTYSDDIIDYIWISFGICLAIISIAMSRLNAWQHLYPMYLMLYGTPTFLSGVAMQFTPLKIGGIICWILAVIAIFINPLYALLLLAVAVVAAWIIPGYLLRKKYKQENH